MRGILLSSVMCMVACRPTPDERVGVHDAAAPPSVVAEAGVDATVVSCPRGSVRVQGEFCHAVEQRCVKWLDPPMTPGLYRRCAGYAPVDACRTSSTAMDFCIDKNEHKAYDSMLPLNWASWTTARETCEAESKRLCTDDEWTLACEGPAMSVFPYGDVRDTCGSICNVGYGPDELVGRDGKMLDHRHPIGSHPLCASPYGVNDMVGNVGEWTSIPGAHAPFRAAGKGGWWSVGLRSRCRPTTFGHDEHYAGIQTGFRCCSGVVER